MKSSKYSILICLLASIVSLGFSFTPYHNKPVDIRAQGMGGSHLADSESFFTLFSNPAGLAFVGEKTLMPFNVSVSGSTSLETVMLLLDLSIETITFQFLNPAYYENIEKSAWATFFVGDFDLKITEDMMGPLTFGSIKNNFGWGLLNTWHINLEGTSFASAIWDAAVSYDFVVGYSIPIDLGILGTVAFGFSGRGITQLNLFVDVDKMVEEDADASQIPVDLALGFGFDIGIQYKLLNLLNIALVWQDAYSAVWVKEIQFEGTNSALGFNIKPTGSFEYAQFDKKIALGIGLDIPIEHMTGDSISHFGIYADYSDFLAFFKENIRYADQLENLSVGAELVLFDQIALRLGVVGLDPALGLGLSLHKFKMDFSLYIEDVNTSTPLWTTGISLAIHY